MRKRNFTGQNSIRQAKIGLKRNPAKVQNTLSEGGEIKIKDV